MQFLCLTSRQLNLLCAARHGMVLASVKNRTAMQRDVSGMPLKRVAVIMVDSQSTIIEFSSDAA